MQRDLEFQVQAAFLCDSARDYGGLTSVLGAFINKVTASQLPAVHQATLVIRVGWVDPQHRRHSVTFSVSVLAPAGEEIWRVEGTANLEPAPAENRPPLGIGGTTIILPVAMPLQVDGVHQVEMRINDDLACSLPIVVEVAGRDGGP